MLRLFCVFFLLTRLFIFNIHTIESSKIKNSIINCVLDLALSILIMLQNVCTNVQKAITPSSALAFAFATVSALAKF